MTESEAMAIVESWGLSERTHDLNGCIEDLMDGLDPITDKDRILKINKWEDWR